MQQPRELSDLANAVTNSIRSLPTSVPLQVDHNLKASYLELLEALVYLYPNAEKVRNSYASARASFGIEPNSISSDSINRLLRIIETQIDPNIDQIRPFVTSINDSSLKILFNSTVDDVNRLHSYLSTGTASETVVKTYTNSLMIHSNSLVQKLDETSQLYSRPDIVDDANRFYAAVNSLQI